MISCKRVSRQARELLILMLLVVIMKLKLKLVLLVIMMVLAVVEIIMLKLAVVEVILFILLKFPKFWSDFGAGDDFRILGVALIEYIDKGSLFGLGSSTNR